MFALDLGSRAEVALNADIRFPTASTIKTAVMVEAYHQAAEGSCRSTRHSLSAIPTSRRLGRAERDVVRHTLKVRDVVHLMIVLSDNTATNLLVNKLGTSRIDARLVSYGLKDTKIFRPTFRDESPTSSGSNASSASAGNAARDGQADGADRRRARRQRGLRIDVATLRLQQDRDDSSPLARRRAGGQQDRHGFREACGFERTPGRSAPMRRLSRAKASTT